MKIPKRLCQVAMITIGSLLLNYSVIAQQTLRGTIRSPKNDLLAGATVQLKGTNIFTTTNEKGEFTINAPAGSTLIVSYIGFSTQELSTGDQASLSLVLVPALDGDLGEVVVVGYGTQRKRDLTGSITTVSSEDFQQGQMTTPEQLIAGKVAGVSVISNSGRPGAGSTIRVRGGSSLTASNDPLFVIDGMPLDNSTISGASNPLSFINPNDIESFTILKDASAAAIYGTRAANGVIIITTKKGSDGKLKVNFNTVNSLSKIRDKVDVLNADQFRSIVNARGSDAQKGMLGAENTDWQELIYQSAFSTDNFVSLSGGVKKLPYRLSLGYQDQDGILRTDKFQKYSAALVLNPAFFDDHLKVNLYLKGTAQRARFANQLALGGAVTFDPTQPVTVKSNRFGGYYEWLDPAAATGLRDLVGRNPVGLLDQKIDKGNPKRSIGNLQLDYMFHFLPELHANVNVGYDISRGTGTVFVADSAAELYTRKGSKTEYKQTKDNTVFEFYLNYIKDLNAINSRIDITGGYSYNNFLTKTYNFADFTAAGVKLTEDPQFPYDPTEHSLISYFGRANYSFKNRYLLTATVRRDGSSRFSEDNRWGTFPSVALAWKIKDEPFLRNNKVFYDLKLRIGYGITGQQEGIGDYDYLSRYSLSSPSASYQFGNNYYQGYRPSGYFPGLKWEETETSNIGLDFGFFENRISGSIDFYIKKTSDLLNRIPQPAGTNFSAFITANVGSMENKGVEFNLNTQPIRQKDLSLDVNFNITYNKNTITNLTVVPQDKNYVGLPGGAFAGGIGGQFATISSVGNSRSTFFLYEQVYGEDGKPLEAVFVDQDSDGIINQNDLVRSKGTDPKVFLGFSTGLNYKKWNAGFVMRAGFGNYVYNNYNSQTGTLNQILGTSVLYNASPNYLESGFVGNSLEILSDYYIGNGSFLKMDNISVGYNVGQLKSIANLRISANVQNVFVVTKYTGLDPEISTGIDNNIYPRPRIVTVSLNVEF